MGSDGSGDASAPAATTPLPARLDDRAYLRRLLVTIAVVALFVLLWQLSGLLLLVFGAVLVAVMLHAVAEPIARYTPLRLPVTLVLAPLLILGVVGATSWLMGAEVRAQVAVLQETVPAAWRAFQARLAATPLGREALEMMRDAAPAGSGVLSGVGRAVTSATGAVVNTLLVLVAGIYLAAQPGYYARGLVKLVPKSRQPLAADTLSAIGRALKLWLVGQLAAMVVVGALVGIGLHVIGVPGALALGLLAGLTNFIPVVGSIVAAVPALLLALAQGGDAFVWTLLLVVVVQQLEGNVISPLIQRGAVDLPPALLLFALVGFGAMFGALGVIFAAPLTVALFVAVKKLYVREALGEATRLPGEDAGGDGAERAVSPRAPAPR